MLLPVQLEGTAENGVACRQMVTELSADCHFCRRLQRQSEVFIVGAPTKGLLRSILLQREILVRLASKFTGSTLLGVHNFFDRSHCSVDEEAIRGKWGMAVVNRVVEQ
jgi:hypothetical protein